MNPHAVLVDTGPLVGLLNQRDQHHEKSVQLFEQVMSPGHTTWPVITEAAWLLRKSPEAVYALLELISFGSLVIHELDELACKRMMSLLKQYEALRLQLADASLVFLAEQLNTTSLLTFDLRDFSVVRLEDGRSLDLLK